MAIELGRGTRGGGAGARRGMPGSPADSSSAASAGGVTFIDEYSHLPSEVAAAIEAAQRG